MNLHDWIDELADVLDVETEVDEGLVLDLARVAAQNVQKTAAPITAYLLGVAVGAGDADPDQVERLAARAQQLAESWDRPADAKDPDDIDDEVPDEHLFPLLFSSHGGQEADGPGGRGWSRLRASNEGLLSVLTRPPSRRQDAAFAQQAARCASTGDQPGYPVYFFCCGTSTFSPFLKTA